MAKSNARRAFHIVDALNAEWDVLASNSMENVAAWAYKHQVLATCRGLGDVLLAIRDQPDAALGALLTEVASDDQLAGRTVLQATLGKLVRMANIDTHNSIDDYVAAMWCQIPTYPLATRPHKIAANLVLDTLKQVRSEGRQLQRQAVVLWPPCKQFDVLYEEEMRRNSLDHQRCLTELTARDLLNSASKLGLLDKQSEELLSSVYEEGLSGEAAAQRHQMSPGSVRVRCSRAVRQLAGHRRRLVATA
jgi:DNA-directed RNA polymerase specialized sigma24 family protein